MQSRLTNLVALSTISGLCCILKRSRIGAVSPTSQTPILCNRSYKKHWSSTAHFNMTSSPLALTAMRNLKDNRSPHRYPRKSSIAECTALEPNIEIDIDGLLNQIHSINVAVTGACLSDGYFSENENMDPASSRSAERNLIEPLQNLAMACDIVLGKVKKWADRARYCLLRWIWPSVETWSNHTSAAETSNKTRWWKRVSRPESSSRTLCQKTSLIGTLRSH